ncbi:MAG: hypothetical protein PHS54_00540 [Clostridia bacterium]|nr:hypothetical protein [Clostridia bacterium]
MPSKITTPNSSNLIGLNIKSEVNQINSNNATPLSPINAPIKNTSSILTPPKGPDGNDLILNDTGTAWIVPAKKATYTEEQINNVTNNGVNTSDVLHRGLDAVISEQSNIPNNSLENFSPPQILNPPTTNISSGGSTSDSTPNIFTADTKLIGQQLWKYKVVLFNHSQKEYEVPTRAIKILCVEDDLLSWPLRGYIIVDNRMEAFERAQDFNQFYYLRSDARDEILVEMQPIVEKGVLPDKIWKIELEGVIYDVEDLAHSDMTLKAKKLYFWDKKFQNLLEKNTQWCTSTGKRYTSYTGNPPCPKPIAHATDLERSMYTGEALASLLYEAGYEKYIDFDKWNWGKSKIQFTAKADWTIWECMQYILSQQISDDGKYDICILDWNRGDKKFNLTPVWKFFEKAGVSEPKELQIEHMFFEENVSEDIEVITPSKAPLDLNVSFTKDIKADEFNKIRNYRFSQTSGLDNSKAFISRPVYSHWHKKKQFDVDAKENEIKNVKEKYFKKNYVEYVLSPGKYPVMAMNKTKTEQKSIDPQFSPISTLDPKNDRYVRSLDGRGKILYAGLFLNQNLVIRMTGSTHRLAGTFIGVDRAKTTSETIYDYQICGQYLVTNVKHIIQQQKFVNDITMVKVHAYDKLPVNEGIE